MLYMLPDHLRVALKTPLGELVPNEERTRSRLDDLITTPLVLVGDVTASVMTGMGYVPDLILVDNHTKRGKEIPTLMVTPSEVVKVKNEAGMLGGELFEAIENAIETIVVEEGDRGGPILIEVDGEEDLSTIAAVDLLPLGSTVVYGQPDAGLVVIRVDKGIKKKVKEMLQEMEV
ncbi:MAG: GTP-dependent dephospho-CoA kinase family protein [Thermoplasmatota archaeon]